MASTAGLLLGAVLLWDVLFRGQLGFTFTFLEEIWSRNLANLMMSPLQPAELAASLMLMSLIRLLIGTIPVTHPGVRCCSASTSTRSGFGLIAFFINLVLTGWAIGLVVSGLVIRQGLGAESLAYLGHDPAAAAVLRLLPGWVLPVWLQPAAWSLTPTYVFEGMRAILLDGVFRADLMIECFALNLVYLGRRLHDLHAPAAQRPPQGRAAHHGRVGEGITMGADEHDDVPARRAMLGPRCRCGDAIRSDGAARASRSRRRSRSKISASNTARTGPSTR